LVPSPLPTATLAVQDAGINQPEAIRRLVDPLPFKISQAQIDAAAHW